MRRRTFVKTGTATALAGLLAGCAGPDAGTDDGTTTADQTTSAESGDGEDGSYAVSMTPVGEVTFESVPERAAVYCSGYADMLAALGHGEAIASVGQLSRFPTTGYDELGVEIDESGIVDLVDQGVSRETFLAIDADVHLVDPNWLVNVFDSMNEDDVAQVEDRVAPFFGNTIFRRTDAWHDYDYYTMYEAFGKVAEVFQETDRFESFRSFHDDVVDSVAADIPSEGPQAALVWGGDDQPTSFSPYRLDGQGANKKAFRDLNVQDAFADSGVEGLSTGNRSEVDYETLLEVDPEVLFVRGHETKTREEFENTVLSFMEGHETASRLTAVENGDVYRGGPIYLGPIQHLYLLERFATRLYPDAVSEALFDREELAAIVSG
ncbi:MAG: ABC transporter substrate-binding protein [Halanaeroarchaeum sp.]